MAKAKFTTAIEDPILKKMKIRAIEENLNVGEIIEKSFKFYMDNVDKDSVIKKRVIKKMQPDELKVYLKGMEVLKNNMKKALTSLDLELENIQNERDQLSKQDGPI